MRLLDRCCIRQSSISLDSRREWAAIGLSIVAPRFRDRHLLSVFKELGPIFAEKGGWKQKVATSS
jgi:hypothetical protein